MEEQIIEDLRLGETISFISDKYSVTRDRVKYIKKKHKIVPLKTKREMEDESNRDKILNCIDSCVKIDDVVKHTGLTSHVIKRLLKKYNLELKGKIHCLNCGKELVYGNNRKPKFCDSQCREKWRVNNEVRTCKTCGKEFVGSSKTYCSDKCKKSKELTCICCNKTFLGYSTEKLCSDECREMNHKKQKKEYYLKNKTEMRTCKTCGKEFEESKHSTNYSCSLKCKNAYIHFKVEETILELFGTKTETEIKKITTEKTRWLRER